MNKKYLIALGLPENTSEEAAVEHAARLREIVELTGKSNIEEAMGVILSWRSAAERADSLTQQSAQLRASPEQVEIAKQLRVDIREIL